ncbi:MAG: hypothetical protein LBU76_07205 [Azoarcus sp.]|jgi:hypothetical protein|nr:hypothetical protein [Azoarcus sp.]
MKVKEKIAAAGERQQGKLNKRDRNWQCFHADHRANRVVYSKFFILTVSPFPFNSLWHRPKCHLKKTNEAIGIPEQGRITTEPSGLTNLTPISVIMPFVR